jgi:hypothetical protein
MSQTEQTEQTEQEIDVKKLMKEQETFLKHFLEDSRGNPQNINEIIRDFEPEDRFQFLEDICEYQELDFDEAIKIIDDLAKIDVLEKSEESNEMYAPTQKFFSAIQESGQGRVEFEKLKLVDTLDSLDTLKD